MKTGELFMRRLLISVLVMLCLITTVFAEIDLYSSADEKTKEVLVEANKLIAEQKYESAFKGLGDKNDNEYIVARKIDICINYFARSIMHQMFAFKDLEEGEDLQDIRRDQKTYPIVNFDPVQIAQEYVNNNGNSALIDKSLGDYYYDILLRYQGKWTKSDEEILQECQKYYLLAIEKNCFALDSLDKCAEVSLLLKDNEKSIEMYTRVIGLDPSSAEAHYNLSSVYLNTGKYDLAVKEGEIACKLYESNLAYKLDALFLCADACFRNNEFDRSVQYLNQALAYEKNDYRIYKSLSLCYLKLGDIQKADENADALLAQDPQNPSIVQIAIENYKSSENTQYLSGFFTRNIKKYAEDSEILGNLYLHYAWHNSDLGNKKETSEFVQLAKDNYIKANKLSDDISEALASIVASCEQSPSEKE